MPCQEHVTNQPTVYVVDDDEVVRRSIVKRLTRMNCRVREFESGEAVVASFTQSSGEVPDVILVDYKMEGMNGIDTVKALRATHSMVPVFIFTAYAGGLDLGLVKQLGNCEVLLKTVDLTNLRHVVNGAMALKHLRMTECLECQSAEC